MNYKVPGISSIIFMITALILADIWLFIISPGLGVIYSALIPVMFLVILYFYCRKCPHTAKGTCRHGILGRITKRLFGQSDPEKYTAKEIIFTLTALAVLIAFPQYWLFQNIVLSTGFWILMFISGLIVRTGVCPGCRNFNCKFCPSAYGTDIKR
ncbi:MAG: hypothetical protein JW864_06480 [Spirochaetes bacterium]|nr:hypothetical protein [Spirochaetota bacterium]